MSEMISDVYRDLNAQLHKERADYGAGGGKWAGHIRELATAIGATTVLDYGCGKGGLARQMPGPIAEYDPAIPGKDKMPQPADLVVCTDVLEHVEPEHIEQVLDHLQSLTRRVIFLTVATRPAVKTLADGRNAHLIVQDASWWLPKLIGRWTLRNFSNSDGEFLAVMEAHNVA